VVVVVEVEIMEVMEVVEEGYTIKGIVLHKYFRRK